LEAQVPDCSIPPGELDGQHNSTEYMQQCVPVGQVGSSKNKECESKEREDEK